MSLSIPDPAAIAAGLVPRMSSVYIFGANEDIGATYEHVRELGGTYPFPTAAETLRVVAGGDAADTAAGLGAREVTVVGLNGSGNVITEAIATAGASASSYTSQSFIRVNSVHISEVGTYGGSNTDDVSIQNESAQTLATISADEGVAHQALYTVPADHSLVLYEFYLTTDANAADVRFRSRGDILNTASAMAPANYVTHWFGVTGVDDVVRHGVAFPELTDVWVEAVRASGSNAALACHFDGVLVHLPT